MKETGIIMSGDHPRLILDGTKTQTRRVVAAYTSEIGEGGDWGKLDFEGKGIFKDTPMEWDLEWLEIDRKAPLPFVDGKPETGQYLHVPYNWEEDMTIYRVYPKWDVGDRLWVRETHYAYGRWVKNSVTKTGKQRWRFKAWYPHKDIEVRFDTPIAICKDKGDKGWFKRSALFLRKKDARIWLEIAEIRAERLQEITRNDAKCEAPPFPWDVIEDERNYRYAFLVLWDSLNAKRGYGWEVNPWCWCISFRLVGEE